MHHSRVRACAHVRVAMIVCICDARNHAEHTSPPPHSQATRLQAQRFDRAQRAEGGGLGVEGVGLSFNVTLFAWVLPPFQGVGFRVEG